MSELSAERIERLIASIFVLPTKQRIVKIDRDEVLALIREVMKCRSRKSSDAPFSSLREVLEIALPYVEVVAKRVCRSPKAWKAIEDVAAIRAALDARRTEEKS